MTALPTKKVAIVQSNYIPWKGYFDLVNLVDEFILYDDMQYTRRDWRNRNVIKTSGGLKWLTIPVNVKGNFFQKIQETTISDPGWAKTHWQSIVHSYAKARHFQTYRETFEALYTSPAEDKFLSLVNYRFLTAICQILGISTRITWSHDYDAAGVKTERLLDLCKQSGAGVYISGPSARAYLNEELFAREQIELQYVDYSGYPEYGQLFPPFAHQVSVIDLIFNEGPEATKYMKTFSR